jgi:hypothetical protein
MSEPFMGIKKRPDGCWHIRQGKGSCGNCYSGNIMIISRFSPIDKGVSLQ